MKGGSVSASDLNKFLTESYSKTPSAKIGDWELDKPLSKATAIVYHNPKTGQTSVIHRSTEIPNLSDWGNNLAYMTGQYEKTKRFKDSKAVQEAAEKKYGNQNISTIGHSQGSILARKLGKNTKEIINLNPFNTGEQPADNEYNVRSGADIVSSVLPVKDTFNKVFYPSTARNTAKQTTTIKSKSYNPFSEHESSILENLDPNTQIGKGRNLNKSNIYNMVKQRKPRKNRKAEKLEGGMEGWKDLATSFWKTPAQIAKEDALKQANKRTAREYAYDATKDAAAVNEYEQKMMRDAMRTRDNEARQRREEAARALIIQQAKDAELARTKEAREHRQMLDFAEALEDQFVNQGMKKAQGKGRELKCGGFGMLPMHYDISGKQIPNSNFYGQSLKLDTKGKPELGRYGEYLYGKGLDGGMVWKPEYQPQMPSKDTIHSIMNFAKDPAVQDAGKSLFRMLKGKGREELKEHLKEHFPTITKKVLTGLKKHEIIDILHKKLSGGMKNPLDQLENWRNEHWGIKY